MPQDGYITIEEAAKLLGTTIGAMYYHKREGRFSAVMRNKRLEFNKAEVEEYRRDPSAYRKKRKANVRERQ